MATGLGFFWDEFRSAEYRALRIDGYQTENFTGPQLRRDHQRIVEIVRRRWGLDTPPACWDTQHWRDFSDWKNIVGSHRSGFRPTHVVSIYVAPPDHKPIEVLRHPFRLTKFGRSPEQIAQSIGHFLAFIYNKYPAIGERSDLVSVKSPQGEENIVWWLGAILHASRQL